MKVEVKNLVKFFGKNKAVDDVSFSFGSGHIFGFIGPNGAGKTTTIKIMSTLSLPDSGDVLYDGVSVIENPEKVRRVIGYMPDALPEHKVITVNEYIDFFARAYGLKGRKRRQAMEDIKEFTGLGKMQDKYLKALSKGMKQRVSLARALVHDPEVLIMDEPAAGLDPRARIELRELMKILAEQGKAILVSSHILSELQDICHGTVIIEKGKILHVGMIKGEDSGRSDEVSGTGRNNVPKHTVVIIRALCRQDELLKKLAEQPFILDYRPSVNNEVQVTIEGNDEESAELLSTLVTDGIKVTEFRQHGIGLEELFLNVTKGDLN
jgi:ABC-2 type transport system ATP-binding protein